ncbi:MAG TPA: type II and III secretion system protein [Polyangiaceae bacterium]|nr:type II and III secretion system protein [Polyangiaceae bacterium]
MSLRQLATAARTAAFGLALASAALAPIALAPSDALAQPKRDKKGSGTADAGSDQREISLAIGENRTVPASGVKQYTEGTQGIVDVRLTQDQSKFILVGLKSGSTTLLLINEDGSQTNYVVNVFARPPELVEKELTELLENYTGLRVRRVGARLFIEGGVSSKPDQDKVKQIADLYGGQVESLVSVGTGAIDRKVNVRIDFFFVQYTSTSGYGFGISYPGRIGGEFITSEFGYDFIAQVATAKAAVVNQPLPGLDIAANNGWAKVLKQASVVTTNGSEASFSSGGEVNVPVSAGFTASIERIPFGTSVKVLPRFDPKTKNLEVKVDANVSDLLPTAGSNVPGRSTSDLSTLVFLKLGQSLVLSGIKTSAQRHEVEGLPLLSQIPVLGILFGSHSDQSEDVEGAIFIVPSVVEAVPLSKLDIIDDALKQYDDYSGDLDDVKPFEDQPKIKEDESESEPKKTDDEPAPKKDKKKGD